MKTLNLNASGKPGFGDPSGGSDGQNDCEMDGEDVTTKSYTWDVDRINRLAQPRQRVREDLSPPLQITKEHKVVRSRKPRLPNTTGKRHQANSPKHHQVFSTTAQYGIVSNVSLGDNDIRGSGIRKNNQTEGI